MRHSFITFHFFGFEIFYKNCKTSKETFTYFQVATNFKIRNFLWLTSRMVHLGQRKHQIILKIPIFKVYDCNNYVISIQNKDPWEIVVVLSFFTLAFITRKFLRTNQYLWVSICHSYITYVIFKQALNG